MGQWEKKTRIANKRASPVAEGEEDDRPFLEEKGNPYKKKEGKRKD